MRAIDASLCRIPGEGVPDVVGALVVMDFKGVFSALERLILIRVRGGRAVTVKSWIPPGSLSVRNLDAAWFRGRP